jgi:hypothetical protein
LGDCCWALVMLERSERLWENTLLASGSYMPYQKLCISKSVEISQEKALIMRCDFETSDCASNGLEKLPILMGFIYSRF